MPGWSGGRSPPGREPLNRGYNSDHLNMLVAHRGSGDRSAFNASELDAQIPASVDLEVLRPAWRHSTGRMPRLPLRGAKVVNAATHRPAIERACGASQTRGGALPGTRKGLIGFITAWGRSPRASGFRLRAPRARACRVERC